MEKYPIKSFHDLRVWKEAHVLAILVYKQTKQFPREELFALTSQMRRAAVSISSNIAEGFGRSGKKEKSQFYNIARGSLIELENQYLLARDIGYLSEALWLSDQNQVVATHRLLNAFIRSTKEF